MAIIAISHQMGAGGSEIGMGLAQRLGYHYVDQELLQDAVRRYGLVEEKLSHLDESKPTLFERFDAETRHYITILQTTLLEFAESDNAVLMGRGGRRSSTASASGSSAPPRSGARRPTSARPPICCAATTLRRPAACATCTRWTSPIPRSTTWWSIPRSSATRPRSR
jgi:hypothetical protein